ncbi:(2,3-dihydroxybenzoyl)adenylate synthase [Streptomyces tendae]
MHTSEATVPWPAPLAALYRERGHWDGVPLDRRLSDSAAARPDAVALVDGQTRITYGELASRVEAAAERLADLGLRRDDRILVQLPSCWQFVVLTLACLRAGVVPVMALTAHREYELTHLAELSEARAIAVPDTLRSFDHQGLADTLADRIGTLGRVLVTGTAHEGNVSLDDLLLAGGSGKPEGPGATQPSDVALFLLSGGTTGLPKLITRTHDDYSYCVRQMADAGGITERTVYLVALPPGHNFPLTGILGTLFAGGTVVMLASPEPTKAFAAVERNSVTHTAVVPAVAQRWLEHQETHRTTQLSSLEVLQVGGSRLADEVARRVRPVTGACLQQVFGMAEGLVCMTRLDDPEDVVCETQGRPVSPDDEIMIVDEHGRRVPDGTPGPLLTRGPYTPRGYYRAPEQNARAFDAEGWYRSGDIVVRRPDGNVVVMGRDKDMINRGGEKISAEEVESLAYRVDGVVQAAAVSMPDARLGEKVCLYVSVRDGRSLTLDDVLRTMRDVGVAAYKLPERLVVVDQLPATKVGKIDKKALRDDIAARLRADRPTDREGRR